MARGFGVREASGEIEEEAAAPAVEGVAAPAHPSSSFFSGEVYRRDLRTYVAASPELDVFSYGRTVDQAVERLKRVVGFYLDSADEMGMSLEELGLKTGDPAGPRTPRTSQYKELEALH